MGWEGGKWGRKWLSVSVKTRVYDTSEVYVIKGHEMMQLSRVKLNFEVVRVLKGCLTSRSSCQSLWLKTTMGELVWLSAVGFDWIGWLGAVGFDWVSWLGAVGFDWVGWLGAVGFDWGCPRYNPIRSFALQYPANLILNTTVRNEDWGLIRWLLLDNYYAGYAQIRMDSREWVPTCRC